MKKLKLLFLQMACLFAVFAMYSCEEEEGTNEVLTAILPEDMALSIGEEVEISFDESIIPQNGSGNQIVLQYQSGPAPIFNAEANQTFSTNSDVLITANETATFRFTPPLNGQYVFNLTITSGNTFSNDQLIIDVSGVITLTNAMLSEKTELTDVTLDGGSAVDYQVDEILRIDGKTLFLHNDVHIAFGENTGIIIENGGKLTNNTSTNAQKTQVYLSGANWKGILVQSGDLVLAEASPKISGAGGSAFEGYEPAAITVDDGRIELSNTTFENSSGINLNLLEKAFTINDGIWGNTFDLKEAIHSSFFNINRIYQNTFSNPEALVTLNGQGETSLSTNTGNIQIAAGNTDYYFKNGVTLGEPIQLSFQEGRDLYFEENTGLVLSQGGQISGSGNDRSEIGGMNGTNWKGILSSGGGFNIDDVIINNAGSSAHTVTGNDIKAALYVNSGNSITGVDINNSGGYGYYSANNTFPNLSGVKFTNGALAAFIIPIDGAGAISSNSVTISNDDPNIAAIILGDQKGTTVTELNIPALSGTNFYRIDQNLNLINNSARKTLVLEEGVKIKFDDNASITIGKGFDTDFRGVEGNPVVLEAMDASTGWGGVFLNTESSHAHSIKYVNFSGGGNKRLTGATEQGNFVLKDEQTSASNVTFEFTNCTFSNSQGWGVVKEISSRSFDFLGAGHNNSFSDNASGDFLDRN